MRIIIDVMSGDNAPGELVRGAVRSRDELGVSVVMVGHRETIEQIAADDGLNLSDIEIVDTDVVIDMEDPALSVVRDKNRSSMAIGLHMLANGGGDAFVSAGNTGALLAGATLIVRRIKGVHRAAIGTVIPFPVPMLLLDSGANTEVDEKTLLQFAVMGSAYMEKLYALPRARVGLLNNGTESTKGTPLYKSAHAVLAESDLIDFVGNVEAKAIPFDVCDVLVCDGFTGNILLKTVEGMGKFMIQTLKGILTENAVTKIGALTMRKQLKNMKSQFDTSEHGGAPLLGISKPVIKAHGSSDARAIMNAVRQAVAYTETGVTYDIAAHAGSLLQKATDTAEKPTETAPAADAPAADGAAD